MGVRDICDAFNEMSTKQKCFQVTMDYVDGGRKQKFVFQITDGSRIELLLDAAHAPREIAELALAPPEADAGVQALARLSKD